MSHPEGGGGEVIPNEKKNAVATGVARVLGFICTIGALASAMFIPGMKEKVFEDVANALSDASPH